MLHSVAAHAERASQWSTQKQGTVSGAPGGLRNLPVPPTHGSNTIDGD